MTVDLTKIKTPRRMIEDSYGGCLTLSHFSQRSSQARLEAMIEALQHEIALGTSTRGRSRRYRGIEILGGERVVLESTVAIPRMMGGMLIGPGPRVSETAGHDAYAQGGHIIAAPGFTASTPLLALEDVSGLTIRGLNFRGYSTSQRVPYAITTESNAGAGSNNLLIEDCNFVWCGTAISFGPATSSPLLDSDNTLRRLTFDSCDCGVQTAHNQSLVHLLDRCAWNACTLGILLTHGGYMQVRMAHTYDVTTFMRAVLAGANGGEVLIDGLRMDGTAARTQILDLQATAIQHTYWTIRGANRVSGQPASATPAVQARSRSSVVLDRCNIEGPAGGNNKWVAIGAGADNTDAGHIVIMRSDLGTNTPSDVCGAIIDGSAVLFRDCFSSSGGAGYSRLNDAEEAPEGEG